ncbi:MAG TPA: ABC transporter permease [Anaerolineales bacterium]|nr:ABC transporter permease [Anaerolineales bacterium]
MIGFVLRRLLAFPMIIMAANFIGYAFAFYFEPVVSSSNPYASGNISLPPLLPEYFGYVSRFSQFDFGETYNGEPVQVAIVRLGLVSLGLVGIALALSIVLGVVLGRLAVKRDSMKVSSWLTLLSTVGLASPGFYIAILLITFFLLLTIYGPGNDLLIPFQGFGWDAHLILPVLVLMVQPTVKIAQVTGSTLTDELQKPYVKAGISLGLSFRSMKDRFAFRNVVAPILQAIASSARLMVAELIIIERLFNWPGIGRFIGNVLEPNAGFFDAVVLTPPTMAALLAALVMMFLAIDFFTIFIARLVDPRLRMDMFAEAQAAR